MAKINLDKIREAASRKKAEAKEKAEGKKSLFSQIKEAARDKKGLMEYIFLLAAAVIDAGDEILDEMGEIGEDGHEFIFEVGAVFVSVADKTQFIQDFITCINDRCCHKEDIFHQAFLILRRFLYLAE